LACEIQTHTCAGTCGLGDFALRSFVTNYGFGLRLHSNSKFLARLDLAYGREGFRPLLGFKYGF